MSVKAMSMITPSVQHLIMGIAAKKAEANPKKPGRKSLLAPHTLAVQRGLCPPPLEFNTVNYSYNTHADRIYKSGVAGDLEALVTMDIKGTNTYAKALRRYRDLFVQYLQAKETA